MAVAIGQTDRRSTGTHSHPPQQRSVNSPTSFLKLIQAMEAASPVELRALSKVLRRRHTQHPYTAPPAAPQHIHTAVSATEACATHAPQTPLVP
ncbi:uncharacterized protein MONOS_10460 [Monocercomonoides exilis]|uniref:uncharacterized protein n=1 Tax=Monocercomonoides exilis TaxID=2049356 RepID=UPI00355ABF94|nr:hypothetical protein MONOS_10460 [Monocercomonoides exilis]|eukprot:MONOS_10460.1-p1 / transcript=MONOS_10460.1 / gene=MONOS_10460 / organism=Monocercomonoides_exilis_PA203 / gene_product=unspecified product / transcript_product=unspecified product / location=Mono_scaffold00477:14199-14480(+) / protein_length=94 / sequence_SO=supercontig / SO=protein_coding / is_pseudo=false